MTRQLSEEVSPTIRILVCGLISADIIFHVKEMPRCAEKYRANDVRFSPGGGGAIAAIALQKLGAQVQLAGRLGDDQFATHIRNELRTRNIESSQVVQVENAQTAISSIFIDASGERQIVNYRDTNDEHTNDSDLLSSRSLTAFGELDAVLVDTRWEKAALEVLELARSQQIPAVIDGEAPVSHSAMTLATHVAFSRQGLCDFAGTDNINEGLRLASTQFSNWVCVTDGAHGVYYLNNKNNIVQVPSFQVDAIDTLGAGDVWHAAFILQLAMGADEHNAIVFANAAAALKCSSDNGIDAAPEYSTTMALLRQQHT